eukprot:gene5119-8717_t
MLRRLILKNSRKSLKNYSSVVKNDFKTDTVFKNDSENLKILTKYFYENFEKKNTTEIENIFEKIKLNYSKKDIVISKFYNELAEYYFKNYQYIKLKKLMKEIMENDKIDINSKTYQYLLSIFTKQKEEFSYSKIKKIFEKIKRENKLSNNVYKSIIILYSKNKYLNEMIEIFKEYENFKNFFPDPFIYNEMMKCYSSLNLMDNVEMLFNEMKKKNIIINEHIFHTILFGFFKNKNYSKIEEFFEKMIHLKIKPNNKIYSIILSSSFKFHSFEKFEFNLQRIRKIKKEPFDSINYSIIILNYLSMEELNEALSVFNEMKILNIHPNIEIFQNFIHYYYTQNDDKKMIEFLNEAENLKLNLNENIFERIILFYCENQKLDEAEILLKKMISFKFPIHHSLNHILKEYAKLDDVSKLYKLYKLSKKYFFIQIDQETFDVLLTKFTSIENFEEIPKEVYLHYLEKELRSL